MASLPQTLEIPSPQISTSHFHSEAVENPNPPLLYLLHSSKPLSPRFPTTKSRHDAPPPPSAGRSKKSSGGRIEGGAELRREAKKNARRRSQKLAESFFYRLKNPHKYMADKFTEEELQMMGLGYDRMVRFMDKDDPNLKHPYDWYKYGEFGSCSWRGVVVGEPVRGRLSDEYVSLYGEVTMTSLMRLTSTKWLLILGRGLIQ